MITLKEDPIIPKDKAVLPVSFFSPYLQRDQIKQRLLILLGIFLLYALFQIFLILQFNYDPVILLMAPPFALAGFLLGTWMPACIGVLLIPWLYCVINTTGSGVNNGHIECIHYIIMIFAGMMTGLLANLTRKNTFLSRELKDARNATELANKTRNEFLSGLSHEIRTPMNSILGFASLLREGEKNLRKAQKLDIILNSGHHLLNLIDDLLDLSKIEAGEMEMTTQEFSFPQLLEPVEKIFSLKAREKGLQFAINMAPGLPGMVLGDCRRLQQVIIHLIRNAIKFTSRGSVTLTCSYEKGQGIISVKDTGMGIPREKQEMIYNAFKQGDQTFTREHGGTGVGLAISRKLVELMRGDIYLESEDRKGATFTITLPLQELKAPEKRTEPPVKGLSRVETVRGISWRLPPVQKRKIEKIIRELYRIYEIFNPQDLKAREKEIAEILPGIVYNKLKDRFKASIENYDDEEVLEIIKVLEEQI